MAWFARTLGLASSTRKSCDRLNNEAGICSEIATIEIDGEGNPTGINSVKNSTTLVADGVYTLDGTRVGTTLSDVQRGAYIVKFNGRTHKVVKK